MSALIEFDAVCKYYQMGDTTVKAADHITMKIEKGEFVAPHILEGLTEGLNDHLFPSCSADSKFSVGWTMASGARESPS